MSRLWRREELVAGGAWQQRAQEALDSRGHPGRVAVVELSLSGAEAVVGGYVTRSPCCSGGHDERFARADRGLVVPVGRRSEHDAPREWNCTVCTRITDPEVWHRERISAVSQPLGGDLADVGVHALMVEPDVFADAAVRMLAARLEERRTDLEMRAERCLADVQEGVVQELELRCVGRAEWLTQGRASRRDVLRVDDGEAGPRVAVAEGVSVVVDAMSGRPGSCRLAVGASLVRPEMAQGRLVWRTEALDVGELTVTTGAAAMALVPRSMLVEGVNGTRSGDYVRSVKGEMMAGWRAVSAGGDELSHECLDRLCDQSAVEDVTRRIRSLQSRRPPLNEAVGAYFARDNTGWLDGYAEVFVEEQIAAMSASAQTVAGAGAAASLGDAVEEHLGRAHLDYFGDFRTMLRDLRACYPDAGEGGVRDAVHQGVRDVYRVRVGARIEAVTGHCVEGPESPGMEL